MWTDWRNININTLNLSARVNRDILSSYNKTDRTRTLGFFHYFFHVFAWTTYMVLAFPSIISIWCQLNYNMWPWTQYCVTVNSLIFKCPKLNEKTNKMPHCRNNCKYENVKRGYTNTANTQIMAAHFHILVQALQ